MPQSSFTCPACNKQFIRFIRYSELTKSAVCPSCSKEVPPSGAAQAPAAAPAGGQKYTCVSCE